MRPFALLLALSILLGACSGAASGPATIPPGSASQVASLDGTTLDVFTYRPPGCTPTALLVVFHGVGRNAADYRDLMRTMADRMCFLVAAPLFDKARFPRDQYQYGGFETPDQAGWTGWIVPKLVAWLRAEAGDPAMPIILAGHSAGSQFLDRVAATVPLDARRIVIANPSTYVWPSLDIDPPFGFRGVPDNQALLKRYLALPITVFLGQDDLLSRNLDQSAGARKQGATRYARGQAAFQAAEAMARAQGWPFGWRLVVKPGVGHDARKMFGDPAMAPNLGLGTLPEPR